MFLNNTVRKWTVQSWTHFGTLCSALWTKSIWATDSVTVFLSYWQNHCRAQAFHPEHFSSLPRFFEFICVISSAKTPQSHLLVLWSDLEYFGKFHQHPEYEYFQNELGFFFFFCCTWVCTCLNLPSSTCILMHPCGDGIELAGKWVRRASCQNH